MFNEIYNFESLLKAYTQARRGKRYQTQICDFDFNLERNLLELQAKLLTGQYIPRPYHHFVVTDPKKRSVAAPNFRDRVAQHALVDFIDPIFEKQFIFDSYACRKDKGTHFGMKRVKKFLQAARCVYGPKKNLYILQCDIEKFFKSIDWETLIKIITKTIHDSQTLDLITKIITTHEKAVYGQLQLNFKNTASADETVSVTCRKGLPIGNLTSQLFANVYLDKLDHFVKEQLKERWYARYMDDFLIIHPDKEHLKKVREEIRFFLQQNLKLNLHPRKVTTSNTKDGVAFIGYLIFYDHIKIRGSTLLRIQRKHHSRLKQFQRGLINEVKYTHCLISHQGHFKQADTYGLRRIMFG